jgi:hypothetical protein|tara:strand:- start:257 stop:463 length:207 start_codon:yes stop_codon:yes gene_type:complete
MKNEIFMAMLQQTLENAVRIVAEEEIKKAQDNITHRIGQQMDSLALGILKQYDVQYDSNRIIIEVKKK